MMNRPSPRQVLILGGLARSLINFRGDLIREIARRGHGVIAVANDPDESVTRTLAEWGVSFHAIGLARTGMNPFGDAPGIGKLMHILRTAKPDVFLGYTLKAVAYGLLCARIARVPRRYALITGLGYAFTAGPGLTRAAAHAMSSVAYRLSVNLAEGVVFQNADDERGFRLRNFISSKQRVLVVGGSGVDLTRFFPHPMPQAPPVFLMIARLLKDKGILEYVEAARIVRREMPESRFILVGPADPNPAAIRPNQIEKWVTEGTIEYGGEMADVRPAIAGCHIFVLPSYREGMPRTVLEAMAMARPIITTDTAGCRDAIQPGVNGLLVPVRDSKALAEAMLALAKNPAIIKQMAAASVERARSLFDSRAISSELADFMRL